MSESSSYLLRWRGRQFGPCTLAEINRKLDEHEIGMGHEIQYQDRWISVDEFLQLASPAGKSASVVAAKPSPGVETAPVVAPAKTPTPKIISVSLAESMTPESGNASSRRRFIFAALAILVGFTGAHNFYARHWLTGVIQLLVSLASCLLGFGVIAPWLWAMVEAVFVRKDGHEMEMS